MQMHVRSTNSYFALRSYASVRTAAINDEIEHREHVIGRRSRTVARMNLSILFVEKCQPFARLPAGRGLDQLGFASHWFLNTYGGVHFLFVWWDEMRIMKIISCFFLFALQRAMCTETKTKECVLNFQKLLMFGDKRKYSGDTWNIYRHISICARQHGCKRQGNEGMERKETAAE